MSGKVWIASRSSGRVEIACAMNTGDAVVKEGLTTRKGSVMDSKDKGIYHKFNVTRTDGSSGPGGKHEDCQYFVLDVDHDKFAIPALRAYSNACRDEYPQLSEELSIWAASRELAAR